MAKDQNLMAIFVQNLGVHIMITMLKIKFTVFQMGFNAVKI